MNRDNISDPLSDNREFNLSTFLALVNFEKLYYIKSGKMVFGRLCCGSVSISYNTSFLDDL